MTDLIFRIISALIYLLNIVDGLLEAYKYGDAIRKDLLFKFQVLSILSKFDIRALGPFLCFYCYN